MGCRELGLKGGSWIYWALHALKLLLFILFHLHWCGFSLGISAGRLHSSCQPEWFYHRGKARLWVRKLMPVTERGWEENCCVLSFVTAGNNFVYGITPKFPIVSWELLQRGHSCARGLEPPKGGFFSLRTFPGTILFCSCAAALLGFHTLLPKWSKMWIIPSPEKLSAPLGCFPAGI